MGAVLGVERDAVQAVVDGVGRPAGVVVASGKARAIGESRASATGTARTRPISMLSAVSCAVTQAPLAKRGTSR